MQKIILLMFVLMLNACSSMQAGKFRQERDELYHYTNDTQYCQQNPERCVNNIPW